MILEEHVAQGVENNAKNVLANVETDESTTVDNDTPFEAQLEEVGFLIKPTYEVRMEIGLMKEYCIRRRFW